MGGGEHWSGDEVEMKDYRRVGSPVGGSAACPRPAVRPRPPDTPPATLPSPSSRSRAPVKASPILQMMSMRSWLEKNPPRASEEGTEAIGRGRGGPRTPCMGTILSERVPK